MTESASYIDDVEKRKLSMWFGHISPRYVSYQVLAKKKKSDVLDAKTHIYEKIIHDNECSRHEYSDN